MHGAVDERDACGSDQSPILNPGSRLHSDKILILDSGAQYTQLIARRVRELGVYCEIWAWDHDPAEIAAFGARGIILSGGPDSVTRDGSPRAPQAVFSSGLPILSICYGQQTTAVQLGGVVEGGHAAEFGRADIEIKEASALFDGLWEKGQRYPVWMSHGDRVTKLPEGFNDSWYFHSAYLEQRLREARFARSEAFRQLLADGWHALGRFVLGLLTNRKQTALRH